MAKPKGLRNQNYEEKRESLLERITEFFFQNPTQRHSMRQIAEYAGVTVPTLKHYFQNREGLIQSIMERQHQMGKPFMDQVRKTKGSLEDSIRFNLEFMIAGFQWSDLKNLNALGFSEGMRHQNLGATYLEHFLEPTLQATENCLKIHQKKGDISQKINIRYAVISLISPVLMALMHQLDFDGKNFRPLDLKDFLEQHVQQFLQGLQT